MGRHSSGNNNSLLSCWSSIIDSIQMRKIIETIIFLPFMLIVMFIGLMCTLGIVWEQNKYFKKKGGDKMKEYKRIIIAVAVVLAVFLIGWLMTRDADASGSFHTEWVNQGDVSWSGECDAKEPACVETTEGSECGKQDQECKLLPGGDWKFPCKMGDKRTIKVRQKCEKVGKDCPIPDPIPDPDPEPVVKKSNGDGDHESCKERAPHNAPDGFHIINGNTLKWQTKGSAKDIDIKSHDANQVFLWNYRTDDDGSFFLSGLPGTWFQIRGVDEQCGLSDWTELLHK